MCLLIRKWLALLFTTLPLVLAGQAQPPPAAPSTAHRQHTPLAGVHRVLVLGDSITYSGQYVDDVETVLRIRSQMNGLEILDLGLPSETVSGLSEPGHAGGKFSRPDLHERLDRVLEKTKPDLVIACYGMNDGIYYPFSEERFQKFQEGIRWLRERVTKSGANLIHLSPPTFDPLPITGKTLPAGLSEYRQPYEGYNDVLDRYSAWLVSQRTNGWIVADVHTPMNNYLADRRRESPGFTLAQDGVHANDTGHWLMAQPLLQELKVPTESGVFDTRHFPELTASGPGAELIKLIHKKNRLLSDAWLTDTGHKRPGMNEGLPLAEAKTQAAALVPKIDELTHELTSQFPAASGDTRASGQQSR
jgi:lysophospholipase L1-like esterase